MLNQKEAPRRRTFIQVAAGLMLLAVLLSSCIPYISQFEETSGKAQPAAATVVVETPTIAPTIPVPSTFHEAPELAVRVRLNDLPPVEQRLPRSPKVVSVVEQAGVYGGTWRMVIQPSADEGQFIRTVAYEPLVRWTSDWAEIEPNLVESYSVNNKATEFTFVLRDGLRWSDGAPFTVDDIRFWYEEVLLNKELTPVIPTWLTGPNRAAKFEFLDARTFKVQFSVPNSLFLKQLATPDALMITAYPAHYIRKFHKNTADPVELARLVSEYGYNDWVELFIHRVGVNSTDRGNFVDPLRPRLSAWVLATPYQAGVFSVNWQRNPYYWKVDPAGNQLPYINTVVFGVVNNLDEAVNRAINGDIDMQNLGSLGMDASTFLGEGRSESYKLYKLVDGSNNMMVINLNLAHLDKTKREIFGNENFRVGLSYAINRQEILDLLYSGQGKPWQAAPREGSPFYDPTWGVLHTEYSLSKANHYLDSAGFKKDQVGNRLGPDGLAITFSVDVLENQPQQIAMLNMIAKYWEEVGINVQPRIVSMPMFLATVRSNQHDAVAWTGGATFLNDVLLNPSNYLPSSEEAYWGVSWANWVNNVPGYENDRPGVSVRKSVNLYKQVRTVTRLTDQVIIMNRALIIARESFWTIGIAQGPERFGIMRSNFHNVPEQMPAAWLYPDPAPTNPEQYFISDVP